jgi:two-component sensor histidine kinase
VASNVVTIASGSGSPAQAADLLLQETNHRCSNDLQMVVGLLALQSRRAATLEVGHALRDAMERVSVLARARSALHQDRQPSIAGSLRQVCEALHAQAEPRGILISLQVEQEVYGLAPHQITTLALVVNELATNAIKHAFEEGKSRHIRIIAGGREGREVKIIVDDDGLPFPELAGSDSDGLGQWLVRRLVDSVGGMLTPPPAGTKMFEIRVPVQPV